MAVKEQASELQWTSESDGHWSRGLDATEAHYVSMGKAGHKFGREFGFLTVIVAVDFGGVHQISSSRQAWQNLRYTHPLLASYREDDKRHYHVASEQELDTWLEESFIVNIEASSAEQLRQDLRPTKRAQLHVLPQSQEVLFHLSHAVIDGHSVLLLVDQFLEEVAQPSTAPSFGDEAKNLPPPFTVAANAPKADEKKDAKVGQDLQAWFGALPWLSIKARNTDKEPGNTQTSRQSLTEQETIDVIKAAKAKGFTPTHVVETSAILAAAELDPKSAGKSYGSCGIFSLRSLVEPKWQSSAIPYLTIYPLVVKPEEFEKTAAQLKNYYTSMKSNSEELKAIVEPTFRAFANMAFEPPPPGENQMISLSSLGKFEPSLKSTHGAVKMKDFNLVYETPNAVVNSFMWTRDGILSWTVEYNEVYYDKATIIEWTEKTKQILFKGLGL